MSKDIETDLDLHGVGRILNSPDPVLPKEVANKDYVDAASSGFSYKRIVNGKRVRIPEDQAMLVSMNMAIDGELTIDGELVII
jgi:hypothetical protein